MAAVIGLGSDGTETPEEELRAESRDIKRLVSAGAAGPVAEKPSSGWTAEKGEVITGLPKTI